ncbi:MAG: hypothetical protein Q8R72_14225 [Hylemonella sp.]|nr:hypothetical protein [Hylemonella sp.]
MTHLKDLLVMLAGFAVGALLGYAIARLQGFDPFVPGSGMAGLVLTALGGLVGLRVARRWFAKRSAPAKAPSKRTGS